MRPAQEEYLREDASTRMPQQERPVESTLMRTPYRENALSRIFQRPSSSQRVLKVVHGRRVRRREMMMTMTRLLRGGMRGDRRRHVGSVLPAVVFDHVRQLDDVLAFLVLLA